MSTRYVWNRYNVDEEIGDATEWPTETINGYVQGYDTPYILIGD